MWGGMKVTFHEEWLTLEETMSMTRLEELTRAWDLLTCSGSNDLTHDK